MKKFTLLPVLFIVFITACQTTAKQTDVFEPSLKSPSTPIGEADMQFSRTLLPGIRKITVALHYFPVEDAVCMQWRMDMTTYRIFWSSEGRKAFTEALDKYKKDFETRSFKGNSNRRLYGTTNGYVMWQTMAIATLLRGASKIDFGFAFVERAPYFTATQREVEYYAPNELVDYAVLSVMPIYFTRTQADRLAGFFDPEFISNITSAMPSFNTDSNAYYEQESDIDQYD